MPNAPSKPARVVAVEALRQFDVDVGWGLPHQGDSGQRRRWGKPHPTQSIVHGLLAQTDQRQRTTDLVCGTIRNLVALDSIIAKFSGRPVKRIAKPLLAILRVAAYEMIYSPATPPYSIVDEAVKIARRFGGKKQTGFVNAILRGVLRRITDRQVSLSESTPSRTLVQTPQIGCQFDTDVLPDPDVSPAMYLSTCFSLPQWLVAGWIAEFGYDRAREICMGSNRRPSVYVRVNPLKTTGHDLLNRFEEAGVGAEICRMGFSPCGSDRHGLKPILQAEGSAEVGPEMIRLVGPQAVPKLPGFAEGLFAVQDLAAAGAVAALAPKPGWKVLDLCAAPGTKTMQLAEATGDKAEILATDIDAKRLEKVRQNVARLSLRSIEVVPYMPHQGSFDAVLLDVPCSNTGVMAKRIEVRFRVSPQRLKELAQTQRELLASASKLVKPGGKICYSTCSIQKAENSEVVQSFLAAEPSFELVGQSLITPSAEGCDHDGAYAAILKKRA